jgi:glycosyltransferase involved in cell wall biosynthesis
MRFVVDLQCAQVDVRLGGNGGDAVALVEQLANSEDIDLIVVLNGLLSSEVVVLRKALSGIVSAEKVHVWVPPELPCDSNWHLKVGELIREASIFSLGPDYVLVPGHLVNGREGAIFTAGLFSGQATTVATKPTLLDAGLADHPQVLELDALLPSDISMSKRAKTIISFCQEQFSKEGPLEDIVSVDERPKLAFVSPLPPEKSGISFYSTELIPALSKYYDVDVIVVQESVSDKWVSDNCLVLTPAMLVENRHLYERVIYHFGNSHFHAHMFDLLEQVPGVVVLHDFYLGDLMYHMEGNGGRTHWFARALYNAHGYKPVTDYFTKEDIHSTLKEHPISYSVFEKSQSVIVHSNYAKKLVEERYHEDNSIHCYEIPLLREPAPQLDRAESRKRLGIDSNDFVVCSFGLLGRHKLNNRLVDAWLSSLLAQQPECKLIFVGEAPNDSYGISVINSIKRRKDVEITGWADEKTYCDYLAAADVAVQLRSESRGETSAAVLDCMNYGLATIINSSGSMVELSKDDVLMLSHESDSGEMTNDLRITLEDLWQDSSVREAYGESAKSTIRTKHAPAECAKQYAEVIEQGRKLSMCNQKALIGRIADFGPPPLGNDELINLAERIAQSFPLSTAKKQLFVDVSVTAENDLRTGIQRVVRSTVVELVDKDLNDYRVEPVYISSEGGRWHYRYARKWTAKILGIHSEWAEDEPIEHASGDLLLIADFLSGILTEVMRSGIYDRLRRDGVKINTIVYDILPLTLPSEFPEEAFLGHKHWLESVLKLDGAVCISKDVMDELTEWAHKNTSIDFNEFSVEWFHLGADIESSAPTKGFPINSTSVLNAVKRKTSFLIVGTLEPRKGHSQTLAAFEQMWAEDIDANLIFVGKQGWKVDKLVDKLSNHPELGKRLFWMEGISDEYLEQIYAVSSCLIAASEGEGFGLPLIEAAQHKMPIIARDIPVFREVAGEHAFYFDGKEPAELATVIQDWLKLYKSYQHPNSDSMPWLTWKESATQLLEKLGITTLETNKELKRP